MTSAVDRLLADALEAARRRAEARMSEEARFGRRCGPGLFEREENGEPVTTLVVLDGEVIYELVGVAAEALS